MGSLFGFRGAKLILKPLVPLLWNALRSSKPKGASFQHPREVQQHFSPRNKGLLLDGHKYRLSENESCNHLALFAPSGQGKTSRYVIPNIFSQLGSSMVITDLKGELYQKTSGYLQSQGYAIKALNLQDLFYGDCYNPLSRVKTYGDISSVAHVLIRSANLQAYDKDPLWYRGAETLLKVVISALQGREDPTHFNLPNVLRILQQMGRRTQFEKFLDMYVDDNAWSQYEQLVTGNEKMMQSFYSIAASSLDFLNDPSMARVFSGDTLELSTLRTRKTALYIIVPPHKLSEYSAILNLFYTQLFISLMERLPEPHEKTIYVLGDEWGHTAVPNFASIATTIRQYRVSLSIVLQSLAQMEQNYGKHAASTILEGGMTSKLFYGGLDVNAGQWAERMIGREKVSRRTMHGEQQYEQNLMNADRIRTLGSKEALLIYGNREPVLFETEFSHEHFWFKRYLRMAPAPLPRISRSPVAYVDMRKV